MARGNSVASASSVDQPPPLVPHIQELDSNENAVEVASAGVSDAAIWKALKGRRGRKALNDLLSDQAGSKSAMQAIQESICGKDTGPGSSLEQILGSLPPPPEGASDKEYAAYAVAAAQYTQQAACALKDRSGSLPLLPGMEEAAALLRASGAVGPSNSNGGYPYFYNWNGGAYGGGKKGKKDKSASSVWDADADKTEQEKLREFWIGLKEDERRELVKIEKHAILKEMKGQQRYICSCSVCGRRREVLEEELEMLYDAYYDELAHEKDLIAAGGRGSDCEARGALTAGGGTTSAGPDRKRQKAIMLDDRSDDSSDSASDDDSDSDSEDEATLANSLTVKGDVLTVSDDLLEDDGGKFFDLMIKIAESRYHYRDDLDTDSAFEDDDLDDLSEEDSEYLEEQRMEEGRRMFQMFAARMIEQRLLVAYREKAALEAQEQLIREEEEAERAAEERNRLKREKEKGKKKKRKQQKKAQKAAGEAEKLRQKEEEERAKLEARKQKEEQRQADLAERQRQRLEEEVARNQELARRAAELKAEATAKAKGEQAKKKGSGGSAFDYGDGTSNSEDGWETTKSTSRKARKKSDKEALAKQPATRTIIKPVSKGSSAAKIVKTPPLPSAPSGVGSDAPGVSKQAYMQMQERERGKAAQAALAPKPDDAAAAAGAAAPQQRADAQAAAVVQAKPAPVGGQGVAQAPAPPHPLVAVPKPAQAVPAPVVAAAPAGGVGGVGGEDAHRKGRGVGASMAERPNGTHAHAHAHAEAMGGSDNLDEEISTMLELLPGDLLGSATENGINGGMAGDMGMPPSLPKAVPGEAAKWPQKHAGAAAGMGATWTNGGVSGGPHAPIAGVMAADQKAQWGPAPTTVPAVGAMANGSHPFAAHAPPGVPMPGRYPPQGMNVNGEKENRLENVLNVVCGKVLSGQVQLPVAINTFWIMTQQIDPYFQACAVSVAEIVAMWTKHQRQGRLSLAQGAPGADPALPCIVGIQPFSASAPPGTALQDPSGWHSAQGGVGGVGGVGAGAGANNNRIWGAFDGLNLGPSFL